MGRGAIACAALASACNYGGAFMCGSDESCSANGVSGRCEPSGFCSFVDATCQSGRRYGDSSGSLSGTCVGATGDDAGVDSATVDMMIDTPVGAPFCDTADPHLVACYEFEGNTNDSSGHNLNATMTNVTFVAGQVGMAMQFGATSAADVAENAAFDPPQITIEAWIHPNQLPAGGSRAGILDNDGQYGFFLQSNGDLQCTALTAGANVAAGRWTHVACTVDGANARIYVDGSLKGMATQGPLGNGGTTGISIAADNPPGSGSRLIGLIDQMRIESVARSAAEICADAGRTTCP
jgi:Concanavalin A-like lectin/glucanases superfamily